VFGNVVITLIICIKLKMQWFQGVCTIVTKEERFNHQNKSMEYPGYMWGLSFYSHVTTTLAWYYQEQSSLTSPMKGNGHVFVSGILATSYAVDIWFRDCSDERHNNIRNIFILRDTQVVICIILVILKRASGLNHYFDIIYYSRPT
jgi:hypothetical protein